MLIASDLVSSKLNKLLRAIFLVRLRIDGN
jgi:hypothetical protein